MLNHQFSNFSIGSLVEELQRLKAKNTQVTVNLFFVTSCDRVNVLFLFAVGKKTIFDNQERRQDTRVMSLSHDFQFFLQPLHARRVAKIFGLVCVSSR